MKLKLYRGQGKLIKKFNAKTNVESSLGKGIYMTDCLKVATAYSTKYIYECTVELVNPLIFDWRTDEGRDASVEIGRSLGLDVSAGSWIRNKGVDTTSKVKAGGYDSVIVKQPSTDSFPEHLEVVIFNVDNIRIDGIRTLDGSVVESMLESFINSLKTADNGSLIESILAGYRVCFERNEG